MLPRLPLLLYTSTYANSIKEKYHVISTNLNKWPSIFKLEQQWSLSLLLTYRAILKNYNVLKDDDSLLKFTLGKV